MISKLKHDLPASLVVFLVALPLCLGVALASGAPLLSGLLAGIIGGVVVGALSGSHVSISGPAAGLTAVVLAAITKLGSFEVFLVAVVIAGVIQLIAGVAKGGFIANYIPSNVIKGLLAAIGIILILKQIPHAVGLDSDAQDDFSFFQRDGENTFSELLNIFSNFSIGAIVTSLLSILVMIYWDKTPLKRFVFFPPSLFVVLAGVGLNFIFIRFAPAMAIAPEHLVTIPKFDGMAALVTFPDFKSVGNYQVWIVAFTIAIIASLETLLNLEAVQNIDPRKREASPNRELVAQGIGNILSGMVGGIPITSVVVRGSVNVYAGAQTKISAIVHGLLLLVSVLLLSPVLNLIPLASLAAILIVTGYKLTKIAVFKDMYAKGWNQFIPFVATVLAIVFTDLLIGVLIGLAISIFYLLKSNYKNPFVLNKETLHVDETIRMELPNQVSFLNKASIKDTLWNIPENSKVIIDARYSDFIDNDILEVIDDFKNVVSTERKIKLNIIGLRQQYQLHDYVEFVNVLDKATQQKLTPADTLELMKNGNMRFVSGNWTEKYLKQQVDATSYGQSPFAIILSCIDSRTTTEHIFDLGLGDIFSIRVAGNILNDDVLGSMEYGIHEAGVKLLVVLGHTKCGAVIGACNNVQLGKLTSLLDKIKPAIENEKTVSTNRDGTNNTFVNRVSEQNVLLTIERIRRESTIISEFEQAGKIMIVGGLYNVETGKVDFYS
ncbi:MAG: carbonic anhydrase family protein [Chryseolinea sp.]